MTENQTSPRPTVAPRRRPVVAPRRNDEQVTAPSSRGPAPVPPPVMPTMPGRPTAPDPTPAPRPEPAPQATTPPDEETTAAEKPRARKATGVPFKAPSVDDPHVISPGRVTPPERIDLDGAWDIDDLASACPNPEVDAAHRLDPYWDGLWGKGSTAAWWTADLARRQSEAGLWAPPKALNRAPEKALEGFLSTTRGWRERLALLGTVFSWRTVTAEQAAAFVGDTRLALATSNAVADGFASGLLDLGVFVNGSTNTTLTSRRSVYRPGTSPVFNDQVLDRLTWAEWVAVTGGLPWAASSPYDRHNVLATELGLRLAEYADVGTVLGERFSSVDLLAGSGLGRDPITNDQRAADMTAVRADGMRIAIEVTATHSSHFFDKVAKWAKLLAERPFDTSGLCVVFVVVQHPERLGEDDSYRPRARAYQAIAAATKEFPGTVRDRVAERMGVATWKEWFPARGKVADAFLAMRVDRPTGRGAHMWEPCDMLDPASRPFTPADSFDATAVLDNSALLGGTPHWVRDRHTPPEIWRMLLTEAGLTEVPCPTPARPNRTKGRALGEQVGAVSAAKPPPRLLGLG